MAKYFCYLIFLDLFFTFLILIVLTRFEFSLTPIEDLFEMIKDQAMAFEGDLWSFYLLLVALDNSLWSHFIYSNWLDYYF